MNTLVGAFRSYSAWWNYMQLSLKRDEHLAPWSELYDHLEAYYLTNGLYDVLNVAMKRIVQIRADGTQVIEDLKPLRNPANRVVEFYAAKLWGGTLPEALPIETKNTQLIDPIKKVWQWSNWNVEKQTAARWFAMFGDMFIKVSTDTEIEGDEATRVFLQNIKPRYVTDFDTDERGYITWIRMDVPQIRRDKMGKPEGFVRTEVWDYASGMRMWEHDRNLHTRLDQLGQPKTTMGLDAFGIDFIPIVWQPFRTVGDQRGIGCYTLVLDKIDEVNRQATRLAQILFRYNKPMWATVRTGNDPQGRPLPPVRLGADNTITNDNSDDTIVNLPGASDIKSLIPPINYDSALAVLAAQMTELEKDLPELAYYNLRGQNDLSGRAIRMLLGDAIDRALEARANGETGLIKAHQMALTIGQGLGLFSDLGSYEEGSLDFTFRERSIIEIPQQEKATTTREYGQAGVPPIAALRMVGATDEQIEALLKDIQAWADLQLKIQADSQEQQLEMQSQMQQQQQAAQGGAQGNGSQPGKISSEGQMVLDAIEDLRGMTRSRNGNRN
jgi:hypothetical protein